MTTIMVIGDPHAHPDYDNIRFGWLGALAAVRRPNVIVCMGDWGDFPSLCRQEKGLARHEGRRLEKDRDALWDSIECFEQPMATLNRSLQRAKKAPYLPRKVVTKGNHDGERPGRLEETTPELKGYLASVDNAWHVNGWEVFDYKEPVVIEGFLFCHHLPSGPMGRPIGGDRIASSLLQKCHMSCVVGHDHRFKMDVATRPDGSKMWAFSAGCMMHPDYRESWCKEIEPMWDRGVLFLSGCKDGDLSGFEWLGYP